MTEARPGSVALHIDSLGALWSLRPFRNTYVARGIGAWLVLRLALGAATVPDPAVLTEVAGLAVVAAAVFLDARRRAEHLFLANLGITGWSIGLMAVPGAAFLELLVP